jgi:bile acid:Na+ symporter, BASS family
MEMSLAQIIGLLLKVSIFSTVFALGLNATREDVLYLAHRPQLLLRSFLAMYVLTPLIAVVLVLAFDAPVPVDIAVLLMAISAGAPDLPKKLLKLGANPPYVYSLAVLMALFAIVTVPVSLALLSAFFHKDASVPPGQVASVLVMAFLAPLLAGMVVRYFLPTLAERIGEPLITAAGIVLLGLILLIVATNISAIAGIGVPSFVLIVVMTWAALAVGHLSGGPDPADRTTLAVACATRFPALGLLVASLNFPNAKPQPLVAAYLLASTVAVIPYLRWRKSQREALNVVHARVAAAQR